MNRTKMGQKLCAALMIILIVLYIAVICYINFRQEPYFYCTDMYTDILYSVRSWEKKTFFPQDWVFGNQLYIAATPNIAAVFYGILGKPLLAMGLAASVMSVCLLASFAWMLRGAGQSKLSVCAGVLTLLVLTLFCGEPIQDFSGWQLWFTMCAYYSCYAITAFLCYGCYIRSGDRCSLVMVCLAGLLSFAMGMQSLRQTLVMIIPLAVVACAEMIIRKKAGKKALDRSAAVAGIFVLCNLAGVAFVKLLPVSSFQIYGSLKFVDISEIPSRIISGLNLALTNFSGRRMVQLAVLCALVIMILIALIQGIRRKNRKKILSVILLIFSVGTVWGVYVISTMEIRNIYFFMIVPLAALLCAFILDSLPKALQNIAVIALALVSAVFLYYRAALPARAYYQKDVYEKTGQVLMDNGINTIYSKWNLGQYVAIASDFQLDAGFWDARDDIFIPVTYLGDWPALEASPDSAAYLLNGAEELAMAQRLSGNKLKELTYIPEIDVWICTSDENLMNRTSESK